MIIYRLLSFVCGYVVFSASGGFPERFVNLCRFKNIELFELKCCDAVITARVRTGDYLKLRDVAKKSGMKMRITKKAGLPFFLNDNSKRIGIPIGICICIAMLSFFSSRIWSINVSGNIDITREEIVSSFEKYGLKVGSDSSDIDIQSAENGVLSEIVGLSWVNVNFIGSTAQIEVRETVDAPEITNSDEPMNLVASTDGQIVFIRPFNGTSEHKSGDTVTKGEVLISGIEQNQDLSVSFCKAEGYITAKTMHKYENKVSNKLNCRKTVAVKKRIIPKIFGIEISLNKNTDGAYFTDNIKAVINEIELPFSCRFIYYKNTEKTVINLNEKEMKLIAFAEHNKQCSAMLKFTEQTERKTSVETSENEFKTVSEFQCVENIGLESPLEIENTDNNSRQDDPLL